MSKKVLIIGAGGVGNVVAHKCAMATESFSEVMLASRNENFKEQLLTGGHEDGIGRACIHCRGLGAWSMSPGCCAPVPIGLACMLAAQGALHVHMLMRHVAWPLPCHARQPLVSHCVPPPPCL